MENLPVKLEPKKHNRLKTLTANLSSFVKFVAVFFVLIIIFILSYTAAYFLNLDSQIFSLDFTGQVLDELNNPIKGAVVKFESKEAITGENGTFKFSKVEEKEVTVEIEATGFVRKEEKINIQKRYLDYSYNQVFKLNSAIQAEISGNFIASTNHNFFNDNLFIDSTQVNISNKGSFSAVVETGTREFIFQSSNYKDIKQTIEILPGKNFLDEIKLVPAADLSLENKDYISKLPVSNVKIIATEIGSTQVNIDDKEVLIKDLNLNQDYSLRVTAQNYQTRDYKFNLEKEGVNKLFDFKLVPEGELIYIAKPNGGKKFFLFSSQLDGFNSEKLSDSEEEVEAQKVIYTDDGSTFLVSDRIDRVNSNVKGRVKLLYKVSVDGFPELTIKDTSSFGNLFFFPEQKKIINFTNTGSSRTPNYKLELMNLEGTSRSTLFNFENTIVEELVLSKNGSQVYTKEIDSNNQYLLRNIDVSTKKSTVLLENQKKIDLHDVSADGNKVIYSAFDTSSAFTNLVLRDISRAEKRTLITNDLGNYYQFVDGSNNDIVFSENVQNRNTLFKYSIEQNKKEELFKLTTGDSISKLTQFKDWFLYLVDGKGLYIFDAINPVSYVQVVEGEVKI